MKHFSSLIRTLEMTNKSTVKTRALMDYFSTATDADKLWAIRLFTGKRPKRPVKTNLMKQWCMELSGIPEWLFIESYSAVGDLGETISLLLPEPKNTSDKSLSQWLEELSNLSKASEDDKKAYVLAAWDSLETHERFIFNKLIGGSLRVGVSKKGLVNALAEFTQQDSDKIMHALTGDWTIENTSFDELIYTDQASFTAGKPYPFCLAYALDKTPDQLGNPQDWQAEYKWDGIRGQIIYREQEVFIWSRGEELVTDQFPELVEAAKALVNNDVKSFVLDGEILPIKEDQILSFNHLQTRLNRKTVSKKLLEEIPIHFYAYDCLELNGEAILNQALQKRNTALDHVLNTDIKHQAPNNRIKRSLPITFNAWSELAKIRDNARAIMSEGLMLKKCSSPYHVGRKKGDWWKWKLDPMTIDAVLIYAQKGSGNRSGHYTDYTFAVRLDDRENSLVTIAKAYSGLTKSEIEEVSRFVRNNATEKFGPVRTVKPELVFEIAFEGIALSKRHKSGVALRFPRISRWRKDKTIEAIDTLEQVKALINSA